MIGQTISHYKITSKLGEGGMGEVYLAGDTQLDRQVAIKVLPDAVRQDPERLARLRREAQAAASLKHPDIATIHALEEADGLLFIVMEYVEGETLTERIPADGMDLDSFFSTFIPLTDALAHAHENGRIHRDLKPANVMMTPEGIPKILDFGLARIEPEEPAASDLDSQARTAATEPKAVADAPPSLTQERAFLGTPAYMSPEQIEGKKVDTRTDLFSFGVLMYEALMGQRPFQGETVESIMGRILTEEPRSITEQNPIAPHQLWWIIRKCLQKDREQRTQSARELHTDLMTAQQEVASGPVLVDANTVALPPEKPMAWWRQPAAIAAVVVLALVIGLAAAWLFKPLPEPPLRKFALPIEPFSNPTDNGPAISPDGTMLAYTEKGRLWIRDLANLQARQIADSEGAEQPFWSPGSDYVGYVAANELRKVVARGGPSTTLCRLAHSLRGAAWRTDGTIVFSVRTRPMVGFWCRQRRGLAIMGYGASQN